MRAIDDRALMRWIHGELERAEAERLERRLAVDGELERRAARLRRLWQAIELPASAAAPAGFADRVVARATGDRSDGSSGLGRLAAAAVLALGFGLGLGAGHWTATGTLAEADEGTAAAEALFAPTWGWLGEDSGESLRDGDLWQDLSTEAPAAEGRGR